MKKITSNNWNSKVPKVTVNPALDEYGSMGLFAAKLAMAKEELKDLKLPSRRVSVSEPEQ